MVVTETVTWLEKGPPSHLKKRVPRWAMRSAIGADGTIYLPSLIAGNKLNVALCAGFDGIPCLVDDGHGYYPSDWMAREFPDSRALIEKAVCKIRELITPA